MLVIIRPLSLGKMVDKRYEKINYVYNSLTMPCDAYGMQHEWGNNSFF